MTLPSLRRLQQYAHQRLGLQSYFLHSGDGRPHPRKPARDLIWAILAGHALRQPSFHAIESLVRSPAHAGLGLRSRFGDDTLAYFTERLDPSPTRRALITALQRAKRNKVFDASPRIGLDLDGTTVGRCRSSGCERCRSFRNAHKEIVGFCRPSRRRC